MNKIKGFIIGHKIVSSIVGGVVGIAAIVAVVLVAIGKGSSDVTGEIESDAEALPEVEE